MGPTRSVREAEQGSLHALVRDLSEKRLRYRSYDHFFYSFNIRHIGKEFDLLKIKKDHSLVLNIELKSEMVGEARIRKQLMQNRYYLSHITRNIRSYTYVSSDGTIYTLDEADNLTTCGIDTLRKELRDDTDWMTDDIESLFDAGDYLISPTRTPQRFLDQQYFLTQQQETYKAQIRTAVAEFTENAASALFLGISGSPGTGKTLLLYDLASSLRNEYRQSAHRVIGQEYDSVIMILDEKFYYDGKGVLRAVKHPDPDYLYDQLLYQGITRTREKLCLIIVRNIGLFTRINEMIRGRYG